MRFRYQLFREEEPSRFRDNDGRNTHVLDKKAAQVAIRQAHSLRQLRSRTAVERAFID